MDIMKMMKQAQEIQGRMQKMQEDLASLEVEGQSGAGLVKVTLNGKLDAPRPRFYLSLIKPEEAEMLEDLIVAAFQDAKTKAEAAVQAKMQEITGGLALPPGRGLSDPRQTLANRANLGREAHVEPDASGYRSPPPCGEGSGVGGTSEDDAGGSGLYARVRAAIRFPFTRASSPHPYPLPIIMPKACLRHDGRGITRAPR